MKIRSKIVDRKKPCRIRHGFDEISLGPAIIASDLQQSSQTYRLQPVDGPKRTFRQQ